MTMFRTLMIANGNGNKVMLKKDTGSLGSINGRSYYKVNAGEAIIFVLYTKKSSTTWITGFGILSKDQNACEYNTSYDSSRHFYATEYVIFRGQKWWFSGFNYAFNGSQKYTVISPYSWNEYENENDNYMEAYKEICPEVLKRYFHGETIENYAKDPDCLLAAFPRNGTIKNLVAGSPEIQVPSGIVNGTYSISDVYQAANTGIVAPYATTDSPDFTVIYKFTAEKEGRGIGNNAILTAPDDISPYPLAIFREWKCIYTYLRDSNGVFLKYWSVESLAPYTGTHVYGWSFHRDSETGFLTYRTTCDGHLVNESTYEDATDRMISFGLNNPMYLNWYPATLYGKLSKHYTFYFKRAMTFEEMRKFK